MRYWKDLFQKHILQRGEDYCYDGAVVELNETESGYWAVVEGTEDYEVAIQIHNDAVLDMYCSCPYAADGHNCKHMAAVLFEIEGAEASASIENNLPEEAEQLVDIIASMSEDDAKILLLHLAVNDRELRDLIILKYAKEIGKSQIRDIKYRIDCLEHDFCDKDGYISYREAWDYGCALQAILDEEVEMLISRGLIIPAFEISIHVFYTIATQDLDDSDGTTTSVADACYEVWKQILAKASEEESEQIFQWFKSHRNGYVPDYMEDYIDKFLMNEFHDDSMLQEKLEILDREIQDMKKYVSDDMWFYKQYQYTQKVLHRLHIMKEQGRSLDAQLEYAREFRELSDIRKWEASAYINAGNDDMAIAVLKESCELDSDRPGLVSDHIKQLLSIYRKSGRADEYRAQLVDYIFNHRQDTLEYIYDLKDICSEAEWYEYREKILQANTAYYIRGSIMESEKLYGQLLKLVQESGSFYEIDQYEDTLKAECPEDIKQAYLDCIRSGIAHADNRKKYRWVIAYLKKVAGYPGGSHAAQSLADEWKVLYKNRPALQDELRKAGF